MRKALRIQQNIERLKENIKRAENDILEWKKAIAIMEEEQ